jgi:hypothetical protein
MYFHKPRSLRAFRATTNVIGCRLIVSQAPNTLRRLPAIFHWALMLKALPSCGTPASIRLEVSLNSDTEARVENIFGIEAQWEGRQYRRL